MMNVISENLLFVICPGNKALSVNFRNLSAKEYRDRLMESLSTTHSIKKEVPSIVAHTCGPSTQEAEAEAGGLEV